jgi:hypothetical protein
LAGLKYTEQRGETHEMIEEVDRAKWQAALEAMVTFDSRCNEKEF